MTNDDTQQQQTTAAAPTAVELLGKIQSFINNNGIDPKLLPRSSGKRQNPFVKCLGEISSIKSTAKVPEIEARAAIRAFFISMPDEIIKVCPVEMVTGVEKILAQELATAEVADSDEILRDFMDKATKSAKVKNDSPYPVAVWRGDMTKLRVGAMMNPANGDLLGCFLPSHKCLDNLLHGASGPRLRVACKELKEKMDIEWDDNGECRVTDAYELPAKYVFHTVGPDLSEGRGYDKYFRKPTATDKKELASCYETCLKTASDLKVSLALCCISTGVFGYPSDEAVEIAMTKTKEVLDELAKKGKFVPKVIFNTFLEKDFDLYMDAYEKFFLNSPFDCSSNAAAAASTSASKATVANEEKKEEEDKKTDEKKAEESEKKNDE